MKRILQDQQSSLDYYQAYFDNESWFSLLRDNIPWAQNQITVFGKTHQEPRLTAWFGPEYAYSSIKWPKRPFPDVLLEMKQTLEQELSFEFNAVLLNYYRNGQDSMGWHRDNEHNINQELIASVSFGKERPFKVRKRKSKKNYDVLLGKGDLLVMRHMQDEYEHALPKSKRFSGERINLTFRNIITS